MRFLTGLGYSGMFLFMIWVVKFTAADIGCNLPFPSTDMMYLLCGILMLCAFIEPQYQMVSMDSLFSEEDDYIGN